MKKVYPIIVTYNPELEILIQNIKELSKNIDRVIICNNSPNVSLAYLENFFDTLKVFDFYENLGIAKAQNIGMQYAFNNKAEFVIQFDQDSIVSINMIKLLCESFLNLKNKRVNVGVIGPIPFNKDECIKKINISKIRYKNENKIISSGMLIPKEVYLKNGGMKEEWFIDLVDYEFCWRLKKNKYKIIIDTGVSLPHRFGEGNIKLLKLYTIRKVKPFRLYYEFRNGLYYLKTSYIPFLEKIKCLIRLIMLIPISLIFFDDRRERFFFIRKGIKGFFKKENGVLK